MAPHHQRIGRARLLCTVEEGSGHFICVHKHNFAANGLLMAEKIAVADMQSVQVLLEYATYGLQDEVQPHPEQILLPDCCFPGNAAPRVAAKQKEWQGALAWAEPRLQGAYFTPTTLSENVHCLAASVKSRWMKGLR